MTLELLDPMLRGGIRNTHFFNGRLLTAEDLRAEQQANRAQHQQLGLAIGAGVVEGLEVRLQSNGAQPVLRVGRGLALTRKGAALALAEEVDVALVRQGPAALLNGDAGLFAVCRPEGTTPSATVAEGVYLFTVGPASGFAEHAPAVGFHGNGVANGCDHRFAVEGVRFNLVGVDLAQIDFVSPATRAALVALLGQASPTSRARLRNWLAHLCFGAEQTASFAADPFRLPGGQSPLTSYGLVDWLRGRGALTECDVPLALLLWTTAGVQFVDLWAVRRPPVPPLQSAVWPLPTGRRRPAEGEAAFLQFQAQVAEMVDPFRGLPSAQLVAANAREFFRYLPAAGLIPLGDGGKRGFSYLNFFFELSASEPAIIAAAHMESLLRSSFAYPAADLHDAATAFFLYLVRENLDAINENPATGPQPYLIFTRADMPYLGEIVPEDDNVVINGVVPAGSLRIGDELQILGRNFGFSQGAHAVYFNSTRATQFRAGCSDTRLVLIIPRIPGVVEPDTLVTLTVSNLTSAATWPEPLLIGPMPEVIEGNISLTFQGVSPVAPTAGEPFTLQYRLESQASATVTVDLDFQLSAEGWPEPEWRVVNGEPLEPTGIVLPSGADLSFQVRISEIPLAAEDEDFTVTLRATAEGIPGDQDGPREFSVGQAAPQPDPTITTLAFNNAQPAGAVSGGVVTVAPGGAVTVQARAEFTGPSSAHPGPQHVYNLSVAVEPSTGWTAALATGPIFGTPPSYSITGPATRFPAFTVTAAGGAAQPATVTLALARVGTDFISTISFQLVRS
jgi:hypothetical protein